MNHSVDRPLLVFSHCRKTAGMTLHYVLRQSLGLGHSIAMPYRAGPGGFFYPEDLHTLQRLNPWLRSVGGHSVVSFAGLESVRKPIRYITLLREPVARVLSEYQHLKDTKHTQRSWAAYIADEIAHNHQTKLIGGSRHAEDAINALEQRFACVGIQACFDEFLLLLRQRLAPEFRLDIRYARRNTARKDTAVHAWIQENRLRLEAEAAACNREDAKLYAHVRDELLPRLRAEYGARLAEDVAALKQEMGRPRLKLKAAMSYGFERYLRRVQVQLRKHHGVQPGGAYAIPARGNRSAVEAAFFDQADKENSS